MKERERERKRYSKERQKGKKRGKYLTILGLQMSKNNINII